MRINSFEKWAEVYSRLTNWLDSRSNQNWHVPIPKFRGRGKGDCAIVGKTINKRPEFRVQKVTHSH